MSWFLTFAAGGLVGVVAMGLAQWVLAKLSAAPLPSNARPCLIRVAGDTSFCQTCGAQWPVEDFAFCRKAKPPEFVVTFGSLSLEEVHLNDLLVRAAADEKAELARLSEAAAQSSSEAKADAARVLSHLEKAKL